MLPRSLRYAIPHPKNGRQKKPGRFGRDDRKCCAQKATAVGLGEVDAAKRKAGPSAPLGMTIFRLGAACGTVETVP